MTALLEPVQTRPDLPTKIMEVMNASGLALMISIGHRTGLFDTLSALDHATSAQIAAASKLNERYVREWLGALTSGGILDHDPRANTYKLPPEYAQFLTRSAAPNNLAVSVQFVAVLGAVEDEVVDAFHHGRGVPYSSYKRFHRVMAEESGQTVVAALEQHLLPLIPELHAKLKTGLDVADIGCGAGLAMIELARTYPNSRFTGLDFSDEAISLARAEAQRQKLTNVRFLVQDAATWSATNAFDLLFTFDAVHDQADPAQVLANIHRALRPGGTFFMQDIKACSHHHGNIGHPLGTFIYTISCMHCMSVSLANQGLGLGAAWGKEVALQMLQSAGFPSTTVQELPHDVMNYYYISRKP